MSESAMKPPHLLLLVSKSSMGNREQMANQELVETILNSQGMTPQVFDGANPANKERRNELFGISGLRAKYPQLFLVESDGSTRFLGDFDTIQMLNESGQLLKSRLLPSSSNDADAPADSNSKATGFQPHFLLLLSTLATNPEQRRNIELTKSILQGIKDTKVEFLDGADLANKEERNKLFGISGLRAKYPQLFAVKSEDEPPTFVGNFETIQDLNERGQLTKANWLGVPEDAEQKEETPVESTSRGLPAANDPADVKNTSQPKGLTQNSNAHLLLLISNLSGNREQDANQTQILQLLKSKGLSQIPIQTLDGSDPAHKERRNELFEISGLRAKYPQLFVVVESPNVPFLPPSWVGTKSRTIFFGSYDTIMAMEKDGSLTETGIASVFAKEQSSAKEEGGNRMLVLGVHLALVAAIAVGTAKLLKQN